VNTSGGDSLRRLTVDVDGTPRGTPGVSDVLDEIIRQLSGEDVKDPTRWGPFSSHHAADRLCVERIPRWCIWD
jgi:hypothetical protein